MMRKTIAALKARCPQPVRRAYVSARTRAKGVLRALGFKIAHCRVRGKRIKLEISSDLEQYRADSYEIKEPETLDWLDQNLKDGDVLLDVGANIGLYSLYAAKSRPKCTVYAVEPEAQNFFRLCRNVLLNAAVNVIPCNFPLSGREGFGLFYVSAVEAGSALNSFDRPSDYQAGGAAALRQGALSTTLDAAVERHGFASPTLMKLDVDGLEEDILKGARNLLKSGKLRGLLVELNLKEGEDSSPVEKELKSYGYELAAKGDAVWESRGIRSQNHVFRLAR